MKKSKVIDMIAAICLLIGSVINIVELFVQVHIAVSAAATALVLITVILWLAVLPRVKRNEEHTDDNE